MLLPPLTGHVEARRRLAQAVRGDTLPQVLLFTGPAGIGKQRLALWLAQLIFCEHRGEEPCGSCRACRLVAGLGHADLHWFVPIPRPKAGDQDKQVEETAESLAEVMESRRKQPLYTPADGMAIHSIASVRLLHRRAALTSVEGGRRVFILAEADRLVPQESSPEAANAMLKLLEEPPASAVFLLTTLDARRLLPTIRSRAAPIRLSRLADDEVRAFLREHTEPRWSEEKIEERVALADGSIGQALGQGEEVGRAYRSAELLLAAVVEGRGPALERALSQTAFAARGEFAAMLDALADTLGEAARGTMGQPVRRAVPEPLLRHRSPAPLLQAMEKVAEAREAAAGNVNPQLLLAVLGEDLAEVL
jgi:DNA polymerase III subunit delta'